MGVVLVSDAGVPQFRKDLVAKYGPGYKSSRKKRPSAWQTDVTAQRSWLGELLPMLGMHLVEAEGFEADDTMAYCAFALVKKGYHVTVWSGDKDMQQLAGGRTRIYTPNKKEYITEHAPTFAFARAIEGDSSDDIKGVKGVGPKKIETLLSCMQPFETTWPCPEALRKAVEAIEPPDKTTETARRLVLEAWEQVCDTMKATDLRWTYKAAGRSLGVTEAMWDPELFLELIDTVWDFQSIAASDKSERFMEPFVRMHNRGHTEKIIEGLQ